MILEYFKKEHCPIGIDISNGSVKMAQLSNGNTTPSVIAAGIEKLDDDVCFGTGQWQKSAIAAIKDIYARTAFKGREIITSIPPADIFIEQIKIPKTAPEKIDEAVLSNIKNRLPFEPQNAVIKNIIISDTTQQARSIDILAMATDKVKLQRYLAIFEKANLQPKSVSVWPAAMVSAFVKFFLRRKSDADSTALLLNITEANTNIVICKNSDILFARTISLGPETADRSSLADELESCLKVFESVLKNSRIDRLVLLSNNTPDQTLCKQASQLAQNRGILAQIADVVKAVQNKDIFKVGIDRRNCSTDWTTAFGLSLSQNINN